MKFIIIKSVFCPNESYMETTLKTITKLAFYIHLLNESRNNDTKFIFDVLFIGWTNNYSVNIDAAIEIQKKSFNVIHKLFWPINFGKYKIFNTIIDFINNNDDNYDAIIYLDHDIYFDVMTHNNLIIFFDNISLFKTLKIHGSKLGLIAINQLCDIRHKRDIYENNYVVNTIAQYTTNSSLHIDLVYPSQIGSIASGAFITFPHIIKSLDQFELFTIYGLDDYYIDEQLINKGFINVVAKDIYVVHPFDYNDRYTAWKKNQIIKLIDRLNGTGTYNYYSEIQSAINFWNE